MLFVETFWFEKHKYRLLKNYYSKSCKQAFILSAKLAWSKPQPALSKDQESKIKCYD